MSPWVTDSNPAIIRRSVDLPPPLGPTRTANWPSATSKLTPLMISSAPKFLRTFCKEMAAMLALDSAGEALNEEAARKPESNHGGQHIQHRERAQIAVINGVRPLESAEQSDRQQLQLSR